MESLKRGVHCAHYAHAHIGTSIATDAGLEEREGERERDGEVERERERAGRETDQEYVSRARETRRERVNSTSQWVRSTSLVTVGVGDGLCLSFACCLLHGWGDGAVGREYAHCTHRSPILLVVLVSLELTVITGDRPVAVVRRCLMIKG